MKTKAEQLEELKATAVKLQQQIEALEKPKQWKPTVGLDWVDRAHVSAYTRLLQYVKEFGGYWEADWEDTEQLKYSVCYAYVGKLWKRDFSHTLRTESTVYMSRDCSEGLVAKLNSGEVTL